MMEFSSGFLLSLSLCLDIGVANIAMITLAMQRGYFQGFALGLGTCVGDLVYAVLALAGMTVLLQYETVRWVLWLGGSELLSSAERRVGKECVSTVRSRLSLVH